MSKKIIDFEGDELQRKSAARLDFGGKEVANEDDVQKNNFTATTDPGTGDDSDDGYEVGSRWLNTNTDTFFQCADASVGAAVWVSPGAPPADNCAFRVRKTSSQSISSSTWTKCTFDVEDYDEGSDYDLATNDRFDAPTAGIYHFDVNIIWDTVGSTADCLIELYKNGSLVQRVGGASSSDYVNGSCDIELAASDYVEVYVWTNQIGGNDVISDTTFSGHRVKDKS